MTNFLKNPIFRIVLFLGTFALSFCFTLGARFVMGLRSLKDPIPVALAPVGEDSQLGPLTLKIQWGGFYATKVEGSYRIFRLLDLTPDSCDIVTYSEVFPQIPSIHDVSFLVPENEHVSLRGTDILTMKPILFGTKRLNPGDLIKFNVDLQTSPQKGHDAAARTTRVIALSQEPPLETQLSSVRGLLHFGQPNY
jgi:hypothetical protein